MDRRSSVGLARKWESVGGRRGETRRDGDATLCGNRFINSTTQLTPRGSAPQNTASEIVQDSNNLHRDGASGQPSVVPLLFSPASTREISSSSSSRFPSCFLHLRTIRIVDSDHPCERIVASKRMDTFGKGERREGGRLFKIPGGNEESLIEDAGRNAFSRAELVLFLTHICTLHRQGRRPCHSVHSHVFFGEPEAVSARRA